MSGPRISIVIDPSTSAQRLGMTLVSAVAAGEASSSPFEVVIGLAGADAPTREVAEALDHPRLRLSLASAATTRAAAEIAWGEIVVLLQGGDLLSLAYAARLAEVLDGGAGDVIARPATCLTSGGSPTMRAQASLHGGAADRARLVFGAPFAPPLAAARALLVRLPARPWGQDADWAWTAETVAEGVRHEAVEGAVYVARSPPIVGPVALPPPPIRLSQSKTLPQAVEPASEAEVAAVLYARAAHARLGAVEASLRGDGRRVARLEGEAAQLQEHLAAALDDADHAHRTAGALQASTSWKVTAPLRALISLVKPGWR